MVNKDNEDSFLGRWSNRKMESDVAAPELAKDAAPILDPKEQDANVPSAVEQLNDPQSTPPESTPPESTPNETVLEDLPDVESLDKDSDYTGFLGENVPEDLANMALRKLWRSNPILANLDGLNDYDEDFSIGFGTEVIKTAYKVGKGFMTDEDEETPDGENEDKTAVDVEGDEELPEKNVNESNKEPDKELGDAAQVEESQGAIDEKADVLAQVEGEKK